MVMYHLNTSIFIHIFIDLALIYLSSSTIVLYELNDTFSLLI